MQITFLLHFKARLSVKKSWSKSNFEITLFKALEQGAGISIYVSHTTPSAIFWGIAKLSVQISAVIRLKTIATTTTSFLSGWQFKFWPIFSNLSNAYPDMLSNLWPITSHLKDLGMRLNGTNITRLLLIHVLQSKFLKRVGVSTQICFQYLSLSPKPKKEKYIFRVLDDKINYFIKIPLRDTPLQRTEHLNCEYIYRSVTVLFEMM